MNDVNLLDFNTYAGYDIGYLKRVKETIDEAIEVLESEELEEFNNELKCLIEKAKQHNLSIDFDYYGDLTFKRN